MRYKKTIISAVLLLLGGLTYLHAQQSYVTAGGEALGTDGTVSYSVGQTVYQNQSETSGSVSQGIQQAYEISVTTGLEHIDIELNILAYPNPTSNFLTLKVEESKAKNMSYQLYDIQGKLLISSKLVGKETEIDLSNFAPSTYFLKVTDNNQQIKNFKIIKN
jgi:hypothetical protein